jgi:hypothetical protein
MELQSTNETLKSPLHVLKCLGQIVVWSVQDLLITADDSIVELPDE